ncbi:MAG: hypothetical protein R6U44_09190 [Archaeoglobaceae archaeon]
MLVPLVFVLIIILYYEMLTGSFSRYLTNKKKAKIQRKRLEAIEKAHEIADKALMEGIPKDKIKTKRVNYGNSYIDVEEIYESLLEAHMRVV